MKYQGLVKKVVYTNLGVEANNRAEARRKLRKLAEALPAGCWDYSDPAFLYIKEWDADRYGTYSDILEVKEERDARRNSSL